jgi:hypothetical protein
MRRKFWFLTGTCAMAVPLVVAAAAFACGSLATLKLNRTTATPGAEVSAVGGNYSSSPQASPVQLRFNGRNGTLLWEGRPSSTGRIKATFTFPRARTGAYVILATQTAPDGRPVPGTPGRAPLSRKASTSKRTSASRAETAITAWPGPRDGEPPAPQAAPLSRPLVAGIALLALSVAGAGVAFVASPSRRRALGRAGSAA